MSGWSDIWIWIDGIWYEGNLLIMGLCIYVVWFGFSVFDGVCYFDGVMLDIDLYC